MKIWTRIVGWLWLLYGVYAWVSGFFGWPEATCGLMLSCTRVLHNPQMQIRLDFTALLIFIAAWAMLARKAWGWWALVANTALALTALVLFGWLAGLIAGGIAPRVVPYLIGYSLIWVATLCILLLDRPSRWHAVSELTAP